MFFLPQNIKSYNKNKMAQITTEYAVVASVIIAALLGMQIYFKRGVQARLRDAMDYPVTSPIAAGAFRTNQYEPGYTNTTRTDIRNERTEVSTSADKIETTEIFSTEAASTLGDSR